MTSHVQFRIPQKDGAKTSPMTSGKIVITTSRVALRQMRVAVCMYVGIWAHIVTEYDYGRASIADLKQMIVESWTVIIHECLVSSFVLPWC